ncbi:putative general transcription factor IIE subunit 1-like [Capsicum annuum]|nr:putative general transcription factor IIE subunit 1-like [Capsicum annuum]
MKVEMVPPPSPAISSTTTGIPSTRLVEALMGSMNSLWALWKKKTSSKTTKTKKISYDSSTKNFLAKISEKTASFRLKKKGKKDVNDGEDFGHGGVWQKEILMGDKCKPLDFSGVIYYDRNGKQLSEVPAKSPRAAPGYF